MKLVVEVVDVHDLVPKDGQGSDSPFVEVDFENQLSRNRTVQRVLSSQSRDNSIRGQTPSSAATRSIRGEETRRTPIPSLESGGGYGGRGWMSEERFTSTFNLIEQMYCLYVRIVKAKDLPPSSIMGGCEPLNVIEAQDIVPNDKSRMPEVFCESPVFVAAEPFEEQLVLTVEDRVYPSKDDVLGRISLPLNIFEKWLDHRLLTGGKSSSSQVGYTRVCLESGYHVPDESTIHISDQRPTARHLWKQPVGILEVGILGAQWLLPMKMKDVRGSTDAYVVARPSTRFLHWKGTNLIVNPRSSTYLYTFLRTTCSASIWGVISMSRWFGDVCHWKNRITLVLVHLLFLILTWYPELILPTLFLYMFLIGLQNCRFRPRHPPHMDTKFSWAEAPHPNELDEEFDTFPII
ncbi:FT-interacting protein [Actinidia chinensis var. chinensis]|uniref:FT-interacting protein n=1 Tax=Actinidia chinensis var. chinensis TaxID=1590841 RepID=A0A2R6QMG3_ACTCC|nr:FT-interacting protein [Actinidia chinensis var. chinensis]